jgi:ribosomal protein S27E
MMGVIDNGGIGSIKKQIFLVLGLFFSWSHLGAMCPQTVGPTIPGEGLWNVLTRVGAATNVIESQICGLQMVSTDLVCSYTFGQVAIGSGGIFTISVPGTYCLAEDVTFTFGAAITISASNVTLDLEGHSIDGGSNFVTAAIALTPTGSNSLNSITIQNGTIQNIGSSNFPYGIVQTSTTACLSNIVIRDIDFYNIEAGGVGYAFFAQVQGILFESCSTFNGGYLQANGVNSSVVFRDIRAEQYASGYSGVIAFGASSVVIEDCIMTTSAPTPGLGLTQVVVGECFNAVVRNCVVDGCIDAGFIFSDVTNLVVSDCIAQNIAGNGFQFQLIDVFSDVVIDRCVAQSNAVAGFNFLQTATSAFNSLHVTDCSANSNMSSGFLLVSCSSLGNQNIIFKDCYAASNGVCGFLMLGVSGGFLNSSFEGCVAQANSGDGFNLDNTGGLPFANVSFTDCVSQNNSGGGIYSNSTYLGDGFGVNSATNSSRPVGSTVNNLAFNNCVAQQNGNDGFDFGAATYKVDTVSCQYCTSENNALHGMNFSSTATNGLVYMGLMSNNGGNGINNLNPVFGPSSANRFISNRSFRNEGVDYFQVNNGVNGQPFYSSSNEGFIQGASAWSSLAS